MRIANANWRLLILHMSALSVAAYNLSQGTINIYMSEGFEPGLASGKWAIRFLLLCLAVTPANAYLRWRWAIPLRKWLGLWAFAFALTHLGVYLYSGAVQEWDWAIVLRQMFTQIYLIVGILSILILTALALTSHRAAMRLLKKNWKRLHRLVYAAGVLIMAHALLATRMSKKVLMRDPGAVAELSLYAFLLIVLLALRLPVVKRALAEPARRLRRGLSAREA